jgi:hypothetical protein
MSLILAIEPDRRQAAQLAGVIRHHVGVELVLADTTEGALVAIGRRVPDLILVPALLAPQDDAALASALRVIAAAAHVRTLTIPAFDNGVRKGSTRKGMFARLGLGQDPVQATTGCDPALFADQVITYLREIAEERERSAAQEPVSASRHPEVPETVSEPDAAPDEWSETPVQEPEPAPAVAVVEAYESAPAIAPEPAAELATAVEVEAADVILAEESTVPEESPAGHALEDAPQAEMAATGEAAGHEPDATIDLSDLLCVESAQEAESLEESIPVYEIELSPDELVGDIEIEPAFALTPQLESIVDAPSFNGAFEATPTLPDDDAIDEFKSAIEEPLPDEDVDWDDTSRFIRDDLPESHLWMPLTLAPAWPSMHLRASAPMAASAPAAPRAEQVHAATAATQDRNGSSDTGWIELVESLRLDIERRKLSPPVPAREARPANAPAKTKRKAGPKHRPAQDEWGFFDPEQCGFAALLAKLDEITDPSEESAPRSR